MDVYFELYEVDGVDLRTNWTPAAADCQISTDGGAFGNSDNIAVFAPINTGLYKVTVSITEMTGKVVIIKLADADGPVFLDRVIKVETYGNASAQHAFDLDTASVAQGADNNTILSSLNIANGAVESDLTYIHGTALTETAGQLAAAFTKLFDVATPVLVASDVMVGTAGANTTTPPTVVQIREEIDSNSTKTGYSLASTGLDAVVMSDLASVPAANASILLGINFIFEFCRNKMVTNGTNNEIELYKDDGSTKLAESDISDDGTDFTTGEFGTPD